VMARRNWKPKKKKRNRSNEDPETTGLTEDTAVLYLQGRPDAETSPSLSLDSRTNSDMEGSHRREIHLEETSLDGSRRLVTAMTNQT